MKDNHEEFKRIIDNGNFTSVELYALLCAARTIKGHVRR